MFSLLKCFHFIFVQYSYHHNYCCNITLHKCVSFFFCIGRQLVLSIKLIICPYPISNSDFRMSSVLPRDAQNIECKRIRKTQTIEAYIKMSCIVNFLFLRSKKVNFLSNEGSLEASAVDISASLPHWHAYRTNRPLKSLLRNSNPL